MIFKSSMNKNNEKKEKEEGKNHRITESTKNLVLLRQARVGC